MESESMQDYIIQQDILLDYIKEFRRIISTLLNIINNKRDENDECKIIMNEFNDLLSIKIYNYDYSYKGYNIIKNDITKHKKYISEIMGRLKDSDNHICDIIHNECFESGIFQYYYLGNNY